MSVLGNSRSVRSTQHGLHPRLEQLVRRHLEREWKKPPAVYTGAAFQTLLEFADGRPLVLDSGCGVGDGTLNLAALFSDCQVVGIDKSEVRLQKALKKPRPENVLFLRADQFDFWREARRHGLQFEVSYLLYPNPWPKKEHLSRRIHGHPAFVDLTAVSRRLVVRSNWPIFVEEFAAAYCWVTGKRGTITELKVLQPMTAFERKYLASGHKIYEFNG